MSRKMLLGVVAILLVCAPMGLTAQEREARTVPEASILESLDSLWSEFAAWMAGQVAPPPSESFVDGRCTVDPNGCPDEA